MVRLALFHEYKRSPLQRKTVTSLGEVLLRRS